MFLEYMKIHKIDWWQNRKISLHFREIHRISMTLEQILNTADILLIFTTVMTYILVQQSCNKNEASSFFILAYCELFNQVYILLSPPTPPHLQYIT